MAESAITILTPKAVTGCLDSRCEHLLWMLRRVRTFGQVQSVTARQNGRSTFHTRGNIPVAGRLALNKSVRRLGYGLAFDLVLICDRCSR